MKKLWLLLAAAIILTAAAPMAGAAPISGGDGAYIVKLKDGADSARLFSAADTDTISEDAGLYRVEGLADVKKLGSAVEYYEPDTVATLFTLPNDKYATYQWNLSQTSVSMAWDKGYNGSGVRVAVIDSGVNISHEDFAGTVFEQGLNTLDGSNDVTDQTGHGSFVTGTLAAVANNGIGIAGLCDKITIIPLKCFGASIETETSYIVSAIYAAVDVYGCDVINLSLGINRDLKSMREAIDYAESNGVIIVAAVGNDGTSALYYPAAYPNVVGVGAVTPTGDLASFSQRNSSVFVTAPGLDLVGLGHTGTDSYVSKARGLGTSYATPHVVAAAAFMKQLDKTATVKDFMDVLAASARDTGAPGYDTYYGYGVLDMNTFVNTMETYDFHPISEIFPDIDGHWAESSIAMCVSGGYFNGVSSNNFAPEELMNRAMFVTVLSRMSGEDLSPYPNLFEDVSVSDYFAQACGWGSSKGIVQGVGAASFGPYGQVSREQMAVFLYRFALAYGLTEQAADNHALDGFADAFGISDYAVEAMAWSVQHGLITGRTENTLVPGGSAKRCEVAAIIDRFVSAFLAA